MYTEICNSGNNFKPKLVSARVASPAACNSDRIITSRILNRVTHRLVSNKHGRILTRQIIWGQSTNTNTMTNTRSMVRGRVILRPQNRQIVTNCQCTVETEHGRTMLK